MLLFRNFNNLPAVIKRFSINFCRYTAVVVIFFAPDPNLSLVIVLQTNLKRPKKNFFNVSTLLFIQVRRRQPGIVHSILTQFLTAI